MSKENPRPRDIWVNKDGDAVKIWFTEPNYIYVNWSQQIDCSAYCKEKYTTAVRGDVIKKEEFLKNYTYVKTMLPEEDGIYPLQRIKMKGFKNAR